MASFAPERRFRYLGILEIELIYSSGFKIAQALL
jgi:hypothetical protein